MIWNEQPKKAPPVRFPPGTIVRLVTGGPRMVVGHASPDKPDTSVCVWFDKFKQYQSEAIPDACLCKVEL